MLTVDRGERFNSGLIPVSGKTWMKWGELRGNEGKGGVDVPDRRVQTARVDWPEPLTATTTHDASL